MFIAKCRFTSFLFNNIYIELQNNICAYIFRSWWHDDMETLFEYVAVYEENPPVTGASNVGK